MLHGALPYVDIWDRKPIGLFLIYAVARLFGGDGVLNYQIAAALFAAATAAVLAQIAERIAGFRAGVGAGTLYLIGLSVLGGGVGQAPVFYTLFIAIAAVLVLRVRHRPYSPRGLAGAGAAMLLCGLSIQVKPTAAFEGIAFGMVLLGAAWRHDRRFAPLLRFTGMLAVAGALPTVVATAVYARAGHFDAFWFATVTSGALRPAGWSHADLARLGGHVFALIPWFAMAGLAWVGPLRSSNIVLRAWLLSSLLGFIALGFFYDHYALPLLAPLSIAAAPFFRTGGWRWVVPVLLLVKPLSYEVGEWHARRGDAQRLAVVLATIPPDVRRHCMLIYEGPAMLYQRTGACTVTPYVFPEHLYSTSETRAIGTDQSVALGRALSARPLLILTDGASSWTQRNRANDRLLATTLARAYHRVACPLLRFAFGDPSTMCVAAQRAHRPWRSGRGTVHVVKRIYKLAR